MYPTFIMHAMLKAWAEDAFFNSLFELAKHESWTLNKTFGHYVGQPDL